MIIFYKVILLKEIMRMRLVNINAGFKVIVSGVSCY